jgi:putative aminopeptidase FrvX
MASKTTAEKWLTELTHLPTASGREEAVIDWVRRWARRRDDLRLATDTGGNLLITQKGRKSRATVLAVAHMDHPAFVITAVHGKEAAYEFRGGVRAEYFEGARVEFVTGDGRGGRVTAYEAGTRQGNIRLRGPEPRPGDIARWRFSPRRSRERHLLAPACDDLAGSAAALAALDRARGRADLRHFGVLLTRAEEMGFVGALHAAKTGSIPSEARILSIETSRASTDAPVGEGPVIRVGDAATVFDQGLTNLISREVARRGLRHQRKLMSGGACEATAFGVYGYRATGLCLPLGNYHNMGHLDEVEAGTGEARPMMEEISLDDFHGLVDLLLIAAEAVDGQSDLQQQLDAVYAETRHLLA